MELEGFESITHHTVRVNSIKLHYVEAGQGPPVLLLHGFPETWFAWRKQIPVLAQHYHVIVPDLRGYGATEKPPTGYEKRTMATDIYQLMEQLGLQKVAMIGHDRGARVATRFAKDYRDNIDRLAVLDTIPTRVPCLFDVMSIWRGMAHNVHGVAIPHCGHLPPEERPDEVNKALIAFLEGWSG